MTETYKIHPTVGIARLGSTTSWYLGPTTPGVIPDPGGGTYRDGGELKCQAAGFWVFRHDDARPEAEPTLVEPDPRGEVVGIEWTVHLANKKASWFRFTGRTGLEHILDPPLYGYDPPPDSLRNKDIDFKDQARRRRELIIDPGPRTVAAPGGSASFAKGTASNYPESWPAPLKNAAGRVSIDTLGEMRAEADGRLRVIPAPGVSGSVHGEPLVNYANNPGWFDNTSDGPVRARVVLRDGRKVDASPSWVVVGPPDFAPGIDPVVTLRDTMFDAAVRFLGVRPDIYSGPRPAGLNDYSTAEPPFQSGYEPSYRDDIYPLLARVEQVAWVQQRASRRHHWDLNLLSKKPFKAPPSQTTPGDIFDRLREPTAWQSSDDSLMPLLWGDEGQGSRLTLTPTQYHALRQWARGRFDDSGWAWPVPAPAPDPRPTARGLDRAALDACIGGAFYPGIEAGWIVREWRLYSTPFEFRFKHPDNPADPLGIEPGSDPAAVYPGDLTKRMACPWQSDFYDCKTQWWPFQRPDEAIVDPATMHRDAWDRNITFLGPGSMIAGSKSGNMGMVVNWHRLGIVAPTAKHDPRGNVIHAERERTLPEPGAGAGPPPA